MLKEMICLEETQSTNLYCRQNFNTLQDGAVVYTTNQTNGIGRFKKQWVNAAGAALYFSTVIKHKIACPSALPLAVCLAIEDALERMYGISGQIKWPNDILLSARKLAGVLCEAVEGGFIIGAGINLSQKEDFFEKNKLPYATSMFIETGEKPRDVRALAMAISESIAAVLACLEKNGFAPLRGEYRVRCINLLNTVRCNDVQGIAKDIDLDGRLVVKTQSGEIVTITEDVSVEVIYGEF